MTKTEALRKQIRILTDALDGYDYAVERSAATKQCDGHTVYHVRLYIYGPAGLQIHNFKQHFTYLTTIWKAAEEVSRANDGKVPTVEDMIWILRDALDALVETERLAKKRGKKQYHLRGER